MNLIVKGVKRRYTTQYGELKRIITKKGPNGIEKNLVNVENNTILIEGWAKIKVPRGYSNGLKYHFFNKDESKSVCNHSSTESFFSERHYLDHNKIPKKRICQSCIQQLKTISRLGHKTYEGQQVAAIRYPTHGLPKKLSTPGKVKIKSSVISGRWINTSCPECGTKVVFWNAKKQTEHYCTSCNELVNLPLGAILA